MRGPVRHLIRVDRLAACGCPPEAEADVACQARVRRLMKQRLGAGVEVVRLDPSVVAEIAAYLAGVQVGDPRVLDDWQQRRLRA